MDESERMEIFSGTKQKLPKISNKSVCVARGERMFCMCWARWMEYYLKREAKLKNQNHENFCHRTNFVMKIKVVLMRITIIRQGARIVQ